MYKNLHRPNFPLFQSHIDLAHAYWSSLVHPGDLVIDATCGNGHDTFILAQLVASGRLIAIDKQLSAIESTRERLAKNLPEDVFKQIEFLHQSHDTFPQDIIPESVKLIVYNLGYLPGGNKSITTVESSTLASLRVAIDLISPGGAICMTCYPGHPEGKIEEQAVLAFASKLSSMHWSCCYHQWVNRKEAPGVLFIQKAILNPTTFS